MGVEPEVGTDDNRIVGPIEGWDTPSAEYVARNAAYQRRKGRALMGSKEEGGHARIQVMGEGGEAQTQNERATYRRLKELTRRKAGGVAVPRLEY